jgi:hypothetical protein
MLITKQIFEIYRAERKALSHIMKKDVSYYLWYISSDFKYCIENGYSTHKVAIYFYECPANTEELHLTDYAAANSYIIQRFLADIEFLIDCALIDFYPMLTIWQNGSKCANILTNENIPLVCLSYDEYYCHVTL